MRPSTEMNMKMVTKPKTPARKGRQKGEDNHDRVLVLEVFDSNTQKCLHNTPKTEKGRG